MPLSCLYAGRVVHRRLSPKPHGLSYRVYAALLDLSELDLLGRRLRFFSRRRFNLISFHDSDHGAGSSASIEDHARALLRRAGLEAASGRISLLCYPRVLGYAFNPLSAYFCYARDGALAATIYEVTNTLGERCSYVLPVSSAASGTLFQRCEKEMIVSPFNPLAGEYSFHVRPPAEQVTLGVLYREASAPVMRAHFHGDRVPMTDANILRVTASVPLMTTKIIAGIHYEAMRLWLKGVPLRWSEGHPATSTNEVRPAHD